MEIIIICFLSETAQFLKLYAAHFDPFDYLAYISGIIPVYIFEKLLKLSKWQ